MNALLTISLSHGHIPRRKFTLAALLAILVALALSPGHASAQSTAAPLACTPVAGTFVDAMGATGTFVGCFSGERLVVTSHQLALQGAMTMELSDRSGRKFATLDGVAILPISRLNASSGMYDLSLAPSQVVVAGLQAYVKEVDMEVPAAAISPNGRVPADTGWTCGLPGA